MAYLKLTDILSASPGGRAQLHVEGYGAIVILPSRVRDHHPMGWLQRRFVGQRTPGMTWRNGIAIAEQLMRPAFMTPRKIVENMLHENAHWWQLWRRMGPTDYPATYGWQALLRVFRGGSAHIHAEHPMEKEARAIAHSLMYELDMALQVKPSVTFDMEAWLQTHYPASRP